MIIVGIMSVGILLTESSISHAASNAVPKLDTRLSCESHGRKAITHGNSNLSIAIGSSVQVALFVAPVLVFASLFMGPAPLDLAFPAGLVVVVLLSVLVVAQVAGDGRSDWLKGAQLLTVYLVLGLTYFFMPGESPH